MKIYPLSQEGEAKFAELLQQRKDEASNEIVLMTTLRYDPHLKHLTRRIPIAMEDSDDDVFFLSKLHHQRLKYGAKLLGWEGKLKISHTEMVAKMNEAVNGAKAPKRVRVTVSQTEGMKAAAFDHPERDNLFSGLSVTPVENGVDPTFEVVLDSVPTKPEITNMIKTMDRSHYDIVQRRGRAEPPSIDNHNKHPREVILTSEEGELLEGTISSIAVKRNGEWITPKLLHGGMVGVTRSFLLELGFVKEGRIFVHELKDGDDVLVSNGVIGVCAGKLSLS